MDLPVQITQTGFVKSHGCWLYVVFYNIYKGPWYTDIQHVSIRKKPRSFQKILLRGNKYLENTLETKNSDPSRPRRTGLRPLFPLPIMLSESISFYRSQPDSQDKQECPD